MLNTLLILDSVRGTDSTGVVHVGRSGETHVAKALGNPFELLDSRQYERVVKPPARAIIGHNRYATQGAVSKGNAHPFDFEHVVGVHNGTLVNKYELLDHKNFTVDSENLYHHMNEKGLYDLLGVIRGAWSLVWWDKQTEELCFLRNKERPMFTAWSKDYKSLYWASEAWMVSVALLKAGVQHHEITANKEDVLYTYPIDKLGVVYKPTELERPSRSVFFQPATVLNISGGVAQSNVKPLSLVKPASGVILPSDLPYNERTGLFFEVLADATDQFKRRYYVCFSAEHPTWSIRFYPDKKEFHDFTVGGGVIADISATLYSESNPNATSYYTLVAATAAPVMREDTPIPSSERKDSKGTLIKEADWDLQYGECACCSGFVNPNLEYRFTIDDQAVCHICLNDAELAAYLPLI